MIAIIATAIACFIVGGLLSYILFRYALKSKYDNVLKEAETEAEVIKKNKLLEVKEKFLNKKADLEKEEQITRQYFYNRQAESEIATYQSVEWFLLGLTEEQFDIYILDAEMPVKNGIEVAKEIRKLYPEPVIIYVTNHLNYAVEAYEVNTYRYIAKDTMEKGLNAAYETLLPILLAKEERYYIVKKRSELEKIAYSDIFYVKKEGKCAVIVHRNGETSVRDSLSAVEKALGSREFIVADRGYLANIRHVMKMKSRELYMRNGNIITVGRERFKHVRKAILDYWKEI